MGESKPAMTLEDFKKLQRSGFTPEERALARALEEVLEAHAAAKRELALITPASGLLDECVTSAHAMYLACERRDAVLDRLLGEAGDR